MILLARAIVRVLAFALLVVLAVAGLAIAVFSIQGGTTTLSLPHLVKILHLAGLRDKVGAFFDSLAASGPVAIIALLCGLGAVLLGLLLLAGLLAPRRERLVTLRDDKEGSIAARRRVLGRLGQSLTEGTRGVTGAKVRARPARRSGGKLAVRATRSRTTSAKDVRGRVEEALKPLTDPWDLKAKVGVRLGKAGTRVE